MFANFDFDVIRRSLAYLFFDGMTFTLMLTALAALGGLDRSRFGLTDVNVQGTERLGCFGQHSETCLLPEPERDGRSHLGYG